jgi:hypothetical protein
VVGSVGGAGVVGVGATVGDGSVVGGAGAGGVVVVVGGAGLGGACNGMVSALRARGSVTGLPSREYVVTACRVTASGPGWVGGGGAVVGASVPWTWEGFSEGRFDWAREGIERAAEGVGMAGEEAGAGGWACPGLVTGGWLLWAFSR